MMSRRAAGPFIVKAHKRSMVQARAEAQRTVIELDPNAVTAAELPEETAEENAIKMAAKIKKMKVVELRQECVKAMISEAGLKAELQKRLLQFYNCNVIHAQTVRGKHKATWKRRRVPVQKRPFTNQSFNVESLTKMLPSFPDSLPTPRECFSFYFTDEMFELGRTCTNMYPRFLRSQMQPPPWHNDRNPWPPKWTDHPWNFTPEQFQNCVGALYMLGVKHKGKDDLRSMFGSDPLYSEDWIKKVMSRPHNRDLR